MKEEIESYRPRGIHVVEVRGEVATVRSERAARVDHAVRFSKDEQTVWGRLLRSTGGGKVEVQLFNPPDWLTDADSIEFVERTPSIPFPWDVGPIAASDLALGGPDDGASWPPRPVAMNELSGTRRAISTGIEPIDLIAPFVGGGFNLVIDASRDRAAFDALVDTAFETVDIDVRVADRAPEVDARHRLHADGDVAQYEKVMAAALAWIAQARHETERDSIVAVMELPVVVAEYGTTSPANLAAISRLGDAIASTRECEITCVVRLPAATGPDGFVDIVESLSLGEVDAQVFIDGQGRFEPGRSSSSAPIEPDVQRSRTSALSALHRAVRANERLAIWGEDDLEPEELAAIERSDSMRVQLASTPVSD